MNNYSKNKHCKCGKLILNNSKTCIQCLGVLQRKIKTKKFCIDCGKEISDYYAKRCYSCAHKGELNINYKTGYTTNLNYCIDCNIQISQKGAKRCRSCKAKEQFKDPKKHPRYIDGSAGIYPKEFNDELKEQIRQRDNYICQNCGMTEEEHLIVFGEVLHIHHIDYNKQNCKQKNLITLCNHCNTRANFNRNYWQEIYQNKILLKNTKE